MNVDDAIREVKNRAGKLVNWETADALVREIARYRSAMEYLLMNCQVLYDSETYVMIKDLRDLGVLQGVEKPGAPWLGRREIVHAKRKEECDI